MKYVVKGLLVSTLMVLAMGTVQTARGASLDTMQISVTPVVTYAVTITSVNANGYQFGTVALGATTISTSAIGVKNTGNISEYFALTVSISSPDNWTQDPSGVPGENLFGLIAEFAATQPDASSFGAGDALTDFGPLTAAGKYGQGGIQTVPNASKNLWLLLNMPTSLTGTGGAQTMVLTVGGQAT